MRTEQPTSQQRLLNGTVAITLPSGNRPTNIKPPEGTGHDIQHASSAVPRTVQIRTAVVVAFPCALTGVNTQPGDGTIPCSGNSLHVKRAIVSNCAVQSARATVPNNNRAIGTVLWVIVRPTHIKRSRRAVP